MKDYILHIIQPVLFELQSVLRQCDATENPMQFAEVKNKLQTDMCPYNSPLEFISDVRDVFKDRLNACEVGLPLLTDDLTISQHEHVPEVSTTQDDLTSLQH